MKRRVYKPIDTSAYVVRRSSAGLGLFAAEKIPKGACIIEYVGRVIKGKEEYTSKSKYLFGVHARKTIDGRARSNTARYINHACKANAEPITHKARVFIFATRTIQPGDEITYDYGKDYWETHIKPKGCRCNACGLSIQKK